MLDWTLPVMMELGLNAKSPMEKAQHMVCYGAEPNGWSRKPPWRHRGRERECDFVNFSPPSCTRGPVLAAPSFGAVKWVIGIANETSIPEVERCQATSLLPLTSGQPKQ